MYVLTKRCRSWWSRLVTSIIFFIGGNWKDLEDLWRLVDEPVLCLDGDEAGQRAAMRAAERALPLLQPGKSLRFVFLPAGEDPDTLVRSQGLSAFSALICFFPVKLKYPREKPAGIPIARLTMIESVDTFKVVNTAEYVSASPVKSSTPALMNPSKRYLIFLFTRCYKDSAL